MPVGARRRTHRGASRGARRSVVCSRIVGLVQAVMPLLQHRFANLRNLPLDFVSEHDQTIFSEWGRVTLELGDCRNRSVRYQLQHEVLLLRKAEVYWRPGRRVKRPPPGPLFFWRACCGSLETSRTRPSLKGLLPTLATCGPRSRRASSFERQARWPCIESSRRVILRTSGQMCRTLDTLTSPARGRPRLFGARTATCGDRATPPSGWRALACVDSFTAPLACCAPRSARGPPTRRD